ncbi:hypothetical protein BJV74DRAFT_883004 [Russula compacta]|nr:hypothetical protein BJV74DRAFT_883004 [Russula compacta]
MSSPSTLHLSTAMASALSLSSRQGGAEQKTSVVVVLSDSAALDPQSNCTTGHYINRLFQFLGEENHSHRPINVAFVTYGPTHSDGPPISTIPFSVVAAHDMPKIPASHTMTRGSSSMAALDGYANAIQMIDDFKRRPKQNPKEDFLYYLWHFAACQSDYAEHSHPPLSPTLSNLSWDTVPAELKSRNIHFSVILLHPCQKFSEVFSMVSPVNAGPQFPVYPNHKALLSGFAPPPEPRSNDSQSGVASSTVPAKRPAEASSTHRRQRQRIEYASQPIPAHASAPENQLEIEIPLAIDLLLASQYTSPSVSSATTPDSPPNSPTHGTHNLIDDQWSGTMYWQLDGSNFDARVLATDLIRNPMTSMWPTALELEIVELGIFTLDFQAWMHKNEAAVARIKCAPETDNQNFKQLVESLKQSRSLAVVRWEISEMIQAGLLLAPIGEDLLYAAFPVSNMPKLPTAWSPGQQKPQQDTPPAYSSSATMSEDIASSQGGLPSEQTYPPATETLVQPMLSQQSATEYIRQWAHSWRWRVHDRDDSENDPDIGSLSD